MCGREFLVGVPHFSSCHTPETACSWKECCASSCLLCCISSLRLDVFCPPLPYGRWLRRFVALLFATDLSELCLCFVIQKKTLSVAFCCVSNAIHFLHFGRSSYSQPQIMGVDLAVDVPNLPTRMAHKMPTSSCGAMGTPIKKPSWMDLLIPHSRWCARQWRSLFAFVPHSTPNFFETLFEYSFCEDS